MLNNYNTIKKDTYFYWCKIITVIIIIIIITSSDDIQPSTVVSDQ